eukprot:2800971-Rhodomonas_salina.1
MADRSTGPATFQVSATTVSESPEPGPLRRLIHCGCKPWKPNPRGPPRLYSVTVWRARHGRASGCSGSNENLTVFGDFGVKAANRRDMHRMKDGQPLDRPRANPESNMRQLRDSPVCVCWSGGRTGRWEGNLAVGGMLVLFESEMVQAQRPSWVVEQSSAQCKNDDGV